MDLYEKLTVANCVTSVVTLLIVTTALLPHLKGGLVVVRDAFLWGTFVLLLSALVWGGVTRRLPNWAAKSLPGGTDGMTIESGWTRDADPEYAGPYRD